MNNINIPQFDKFSPLLKFKLWLSVIYDVTALVIYLAIICTVIYLLILSVPTLIKIST